jgi:hypothetical protein
MVGRRMYLAACVVAATLLVGGDRSRAQDTVPVPTPGPVSAPTAAAPVAGATAMPMQAAPVAGAAAMPMQAAPAGTVLRGFAPQGGIGTTPYLGNTRGMGAYSVNYDRMRYRVGPRTRQVYNTAPRRGLFRRWRWR